MVTSKRMRRLLTAPTTLAVLLMFFTAPFVHLHQNGRHGHGRLGSHGHETIIHAHLPEAAGADQGPGSEKPNLSDATHDGKPVTIFLTLQAKYIPLLFPGFHVEASARLAPNPIVVAAAISGDDPSTHDPPHLDLTIPRAPPA